MNEVSLSSLTWLLSGISQSNDRNKWYNWGQVSWSTTQKSKFFPSIGSFISFLSCDLSLSPFPFSLSHTTWCVMQPAALNKYWPSSHQNRGSDTLFSRHYPVEEISLEHWQISRAIIVCDHPARKGTWPVRHPVVFLWGNRTEQQAA